MSPAAKQGPPTSGLSMHKRRLTSASRPPADWRGTLVGAQRASDLLARRHRLAHALDNIRRNEIHELRRRRFDQLHVALDHFRRVHLADRDALHELIHDRYVLGRGLVAIEPGAR